MTTNRIIVAAFCTVLFFFAGISTGQADAQDGNSPRAFPSPKGWKTTDEITFGAAIGEVVSKNPTGAPAGLNLLMNGSQKVLYVNLGPNLGDNLKRSIVSGKVIQVVGVVQTFNGQDYLLARQLVTDDQKIEIRSQRGFLTHATTGTASRSSRLQSNQFGGAR